MTNQIIEEKVRELDRIPMQDNLRGLLVDIFRTALQEVHTSADKAGYERGEKNYKQILRMRGYNKIVDDIELEINQMKALSPTDNNKEDTDK